MGRHIKQGDSVIVTAGNDKGTVGEVISVNPKHDTCIVKGVNVRTKHMKPTQQNQQGGIIKTEMPVHISNVRSRRGMVLNSTFFVARDRARTRT